MLFLDKLGVFGLILSLGRFAALRAVLFGDPGLLEAEGGGALSEVGLQEGPCPPVVVVGDVLEGNFLLPEDLALDPGRGEDCEEGPNAGDDESEYVDDSDAAGRVEVDGGLPEVETEGKDEEGELEGLVDEPDQVLPEGDGVGKPPEEVVLVDPVLHDEDEDEDGSAQGEHEAVPADNVGVDDVEGVAGRVAEGGVLEGLVELDLEKVDGLVAGVLAGVEEVGDGGGRQHHLPDNADEPRDDDQTLDLVDEAVGGEAKKLFDDAQALLWCRPANADFLISPGPVAQSVFEKPTNQILKLTLNPYFSLLNRSSTNKHSTAKNHACNTDITAFIFLLLVMTISRFSNRNSLEIREIIKSQILYRQTGVKKINVMQIFYL